MAHVAPANTAISRDAPPERMVRHVFWKYPILSVVMVIVVAALALLLGSPNYPRATIAAAATSNPGGAVLAFTQELDGTSTSTGNAQEFGVGDPRETFVLAPLRSALPLLGPIAVPGLPTLQASQVRDSLATYDSAGVEQRTTWASAYQDSLGTITPQGGAAMGTMSPDGGKLSTLTGTFGPVPTLLEADLFLARTGYLERYYQSVDSGHSFHLVNIWIYDHPDMLNTAVAQGLTDDQWGMVKERGFSVGPWYLIVPSVFHVYFPGGATGSGFVLWNLGFALLLLFVVPLVPGVRDLPKHLKLYRFMYRYPKPGEMDQVALRERHGSVHGGSSEGG